MPLSTEGHNSRPRPGICNVESSQRANLLKMIFAIWKLDLKWNACCISDCRKPARPACRRLLPRGGIPYCVMVRTIPRPDSRAGANVSGAGCFVSGQWECMQPNSPFRASPAPSRNEPSFSRSPRAGGEQSLHHPLAGIRRRIGRIPSLLARFRRLKGARNIFLDGRVAGDKLS